MRNNIKTLVLLVVILISIVISHVYADDRTMLNDNIVVIEASSKSDTAPLSLKGFSLILEKLNFYNGYDNYDYYQRIKNSIELFQETVINRIDSLTTRLVKISNEYNEYDTIKEIFDSYNLNGIEDRNFKTPEDIKVLESLLDDLERELRYLLSPYKNKKRYSKGKSEDETYFGDDTASIKASDQYEYLLQSSVINLDQKNELAVRYLSLLIDNAVLYSKAKNSEVADKILGVSNPVKKIEIIDSINDDEIWVQVVKSIEDGDILYRTLNGFTFEECVLIAKSVSYYSIARPVLVYLFSYGTYKGKFVDHDVLDKWSYHFTKDFNILPEINEYMKKRIIEEYPRRYFYSKLDNSVLPYKVYVEPLSDFANQDILENNSELLKDISYYSRNSSGIMIGVAPINKVVTEEDPTDDFINFVKSNKIYSDPSVTDLKVDSYNFMNLTTNTSTMMKKGADLSIEKYPTTSSTDSAKVPLLIRFKNDDLLSRSYIVPTSDLSMLLSVLNTTPRDVEIFPGKYISIKNCKMHNFVQENIKYDKDVLDSGDGSITVMEKANNSINIDEVRIPINENGEYVIKLGPKGNIYDFNDIITSSISEKFITSFYNKLLFIGYKITDKEITKAMMKEQSKVSSIKLHAFALRKMLEELQFLDF